MINYNIIFFNKLLSSKTAGNSVPLPEPDDRELKVDCFRSFPRPLSGGGPASVSSHSWLSMLILSD